MEEQKKEQIISPMSEIDMLYSFRNEHLEKFVSSKIFTKLYSEMYAPNDVVVHVIRPSGQPGVPGIEIKKKAKEMRDSEASINDKERKVLLVIDKIIEETKKNA